MPAGGDGSQRSTSRRIGQSSKRHVQPGVPMNPSLKTAVEEV
jgi:hypothetical protein